MWYLVKKNFFRDIDFLILIVYLYELFLELRNLFNYCDFNILKVCYGVLKNCKVYKRDKDIIKYK